MRADEGGRTVVVEMPLGGGAVVDLTPPGANARTRVHEYGGGAASGATATLVIFSEFVRPAVSIGVDGAGIAARGRSRRSRAELRRRAPLRRRQS